MSEKNSQITHLIVAYDFMGQEFKAGLRGAGIKIEKLEPAPVEEDRDYRKLPVHRLAARLGLEKYDKAAPFNDDIQESKVVKIPVSQHIGAPAMPIVNKGDVVTAGQKIAEAREGLSVAIHSSINGVVDKVTEKEIVIKAK